MKTNHINRIKGNISISTKLKSANILDGAYRSIFKGKSLNFEELREYNLGDSVKDIDWRASARSMNLLVKEHIAEKKHNIMFVLDSKYAMNANCNSLDLKRDIAVDVAGSLAYLAYKNGDYTGAIYIDDNKPKFFPFNQALFHIENFLTNYDEDLKNQSIKDKKENSLNDALKYLVSFINKRSVIFIITDLIGLEEINEEYIKTLSYRSNIMIMVISDINLFDNKSYDLDSRKYFSKMFLNNKKLAMIEQEEKQKVYDKLTSDYSKYKIIIVEIRNKEEIISKIIELLERNRDANN